MLREAVMAQSEREYRYLPGGTFKPGTDLTRNRSAQWLRSVRCVGSSPTAQCSQSYITSYVNIKSPKSHRKFKTSVPVDSSLF
jgi:hypothetical protein